MINFNDANACLCPTKHIFNNDNTKCVDPSTLSTPTLNLTLAEKLELKVLVESTEAEFTGNIKWSVTSPTDAIRDDLKTFLQS